MKHESEDTYPASQFRAQPAGPWDHKRLSVAMAGKFVGPSTLINLDLVMDPTGSLSAVP